MQVITTTKTNKMSSSSDSEDSVVEDSEDDEFVKKMQAKFASGASDNLILKADTASFSSFQVFL